VSTAKTAGDLLMDRLLAGEEFSLPAWWTGQPHSEQQRVRDWVRKALREAVRFRISPHCRCCRLLPHSDRCHR
jgi:hypothetical protein